MGTLNLGTGVTLSGSGSTLSLTSSLDVSGKVTNSGQLYIIGCPTNSASGAGTADSFHVISSRGLSFVTDRITIPTAGLYLITFNTICDSTSTRQDTDVRVNGSIIGSALSENATVGFHYRGWSLPYYCNENDYIQFDNDDWYNNAVTTFDQWRTASVTLLG